MENDTILTCRIKKLCKEKNISVKEMLEQCQINKGFIYDVEKKDTKPTIDKIEKIADYLGCSVDYLVGRTDVIVDTDIKGSDNFNINNLFLRLKDLNLTAKKLSDDTGISSGNISDWKSGRSHPSAPNLL